MQEALHWGAYFDGLEAYALGRLGRTDSLWALLAMGAGNLAIFYNVSLAAGRAVSGFRGVRLLIKYVPANQHSSIC